MLESQRRRFEHVTPAETRGDSAKARYFREHKRELRSEIILNGLTYDEVAVREAELIGARRNRNPSQRKQSECDPAALRNGAAARGCCEPARGGDRRALAPWRQSPREAARILARADRAKAEALGEALMEDG
jgi:hypothetical protein